MKLRFSLAPPLVVGDALSTKLSNLPKIGWCFETESRENITKLLRRKIYFRKVQLMFPWRILYSTMDRMVYEAGFSKQCIARALRIFTYFSREFCLGFRIPVFLSQTEGRSPMKHRYLKYCYTFLTLFST